jgi:hypothetical protein
MGTTPSLVERRGDGSLPSPLLFGAAKQRFHNLGVRNSLVLAHCPAVIEGLPNGTVSHQVLRNSWSSASGIQP